MIGQISELLQRQGLDLKLRPYSIVTVGDNAGLIETVADARSIDDLKRHVPGYRSLLDYYERVYGPRGSPGFRVAQENFARSLAGYSLVTYLLDVKDRHV